MRFWLDSADAELKEPEGCTGANELASAAG